MKLVVGLGNPGNKYKYSRHNIGFMVVDKLAKELLPVEKSEKAWRAERKFSAEICRVKEDLLLVRPQTYMNRSGSSVLKLMNFYKTELANLYVVHDDIDLPLGKLRIRLGGGSAGHNGIESIISYSGDGFVRFRLGIGRGKLNLQQTANYNLHRREIEKYVLSLFRDSEIGEVKKMIKKTVEALKMAIEKDMKRTMNKFN